MLVNSNLDIEKNKKDYFNKNKAVIKMNYESINQTKLYF